MKKFLSVLLVACLLVCSFPLDLTYAETIDPFEDDDDIRVIIPFKDKESLGEDILNDMTNDNTKDPSGFSSDTSNPYGISGDDTVTLLTKDEVFEFISFNYNAQRAALARYTVTNGSTSVEGGGYNSVSDANGSLAALNNLGYAQGVAFDATGCGRKNYVAILGYKMNSDGANGSAHVVIINADEKRIVEDFTMSHNQFGWLANYKLDTVDSKNFFQITAGDYDGDGRDSLVIWDGCNLREIYTYKVNGSLLWQSDGTSLNAKALNMTWYNSGAASSKNVNDRLGVSLASGDVNGDGIDDLVVVSCAGKMSKDYYSKGYGAAMCAQLRVVLGEKNARLSAAKTDLDSDVQDNSVSMEAPGVAIGDINGDGVNEIVCAGFKSEWSGGSQVKVKDDSDASKKVLVYAWYTVTKNTKGEQELNRKKFSSTNDISAISKDDSLREDENNWQQVSVECVAFDGINTTDYVFINGYVYKLNTKSSEFESVYKPAVFSSLVTHVLGKDVNEVFVYSAAVGNFYQSSKGEESIILSVGYKRNKSDRYYFQRVIIKKTNGSWSQDIYWDGTEYRVFTDEGFWTTDQTKDWGDNYKQGCRCCYALSCCIVAVDYGYDSMVAKYNRKEFTYTDPNVVAVLQAAPYFEELGAGNSSTKYSYSESYKKGESSSSEVSFGVGISAELQAGAVKTEVEETVTNGITEEYEESLTTEFVITFEANDKNQVIVRRTLVYFYYYDIVSGVDSNGNYTYNESQIVISVPQYPVITQLSIEQYNDFAAAYNTLYGDGTLKSASYYLDKISGDAIEKYYLNNEGNPYNYANDTTDYKYGYDLTDSKTWMQLGHAGGTSEQGYSSELAKEVTTVVSEGVSCNMKLMFGGGWGSFEAYAGVTASMDALRTKGVSTATITKTETTGAVQNLSDSEEDWKYKFNWKAIAWKTEGELFNGVLFVGYAVDSASIASLPVPVSDLTATFPSDKEDYVLLKWKSPDQDEGRPQVTEFRIFRVDNGTYTKIGTVDNTGNGKTHTYYYDATKYDKAIITFAVQAVRNVANDSAKSKYSNEATCILTLTAMTVKEMIDSARTDLQAKIDALEESLENGTSNAVTKAIEDLTAAYKAADETLKEYVDEEISDIYEYINGLQNTLENADDELQKAIDKVQENLDKAVEELKDLIAKGDKANAEELQSAIEKLTLEYKAADALLSSDISDLSAVVAELEGDLASANDTLSAAIDKVQENLDKAVEELKDLIAKGDKANTDELQEAIEKLTNEYKAADELLNINLSLSSDKITALEKTVNDANSALKIAIDTVQENLDKAIEEMNKLISEKDSTNKEALQKAVDTLTSAYKAADAILKQDIDGVSYKLSQLEKSLKASDNTLQVALDKVNAELKQIKQELQNAIDTDVEQIGKKFDELKSALEAADVLINNEIADLKKQNETYDGIIATINEAIDVLQTQFDELSDELSELKDKIALSNGDYSQVIEALEKVTQEQQKTINNWKTLSIIGIGVAGVSLFGSVLQLLTRKKKQG